MVSPEKLREKNFVPDFREIARSNAGQQLEDYTGFPEPCHSYVIKYETATRSIEEIYYFLLDEIRVGQAHAIVDKITDIFSASEQSSFFGTAQQRIGLQQEKVSMFLATVGKMVKELFQLVREIRILKERLGYYKDSFEGESKSRESAEITLKGIWVDMVEQGAKNPASVYGMARELQFVTLPDLFYSIHPRNAAEVDEMVDRLEFNNKVKEVLKRKLRQFQEWKVSTYDEIKSRHIFTLKYLRQHYDIIKMYMTWVKPYLRNIRRMQIKDRTNEVDLINAFEGSLVEIEFLARMLPQSKEVAKEVIRNQEYWSVFLMHFRYRTKPQMNYIQEYQRGPLHIGMCEIHFYGYAWTMEQIEQYKKMIDEEDMELLASIDGSVKAAMEALGDELEAYLKEAGEKVDFKNELSLKEEVAKAVDPFTSVFRGFGDIFRSFKSDKKSGLNSVEREKEERRAKFSIQHALYQAYKNFKKREGMLAW